MHVIINTRCSWLHGDRRGFRDRKHRRHSTGDYKKPPPKGEHCGLYHYFHSRAGEQVTFDEAMRIRVARAFVLKLISLEWRAIACSVGENHLHVLVELPNDYEQMKWEIGKCKQRASHAVREELPGTIWAAGGEYKRIKDVGHLHNAYDYIRLKQDVGTVVWSHNQDEDWLTNPAVGIPIMSGPRQHTRVFAQGSEPGVG